MRVVLKLKNADLFYSENTKTGLTRSLKAANNCDIAYVLEKSPELLTMFDFYLAVGKTLYHKIS